MNVLITNKVYYKIFDLSFKGSSHIYNKKNMALNSLLPNSLEVIHNNRKTIVNYCHAQNIVILKQVHGAKIIDADLINDFTIDLEVDGVITSKNNLVLAIQTADCAPILLASSDGSLIGVAHCGWQGSKAGIVANIVTIMQAKGAKDICAIIGPSIQQYSYEVNEEFYNRFVGERDLCKILYSFTLRETLYV